MAETRVDREFNTDADVRRELETVMPVIASTLVQAIGTDSCAFYVYDETASRTIAAFRYGYAQVVFPSAVDHDKLSPKSIPIEAELLRTRRTVRRFTEDDFRRWPMHNEVLRERAKRYSDIAVPLVWDGDVLGVVYLWRRGSTVPFNDAEISIAEDLGQVAAMAVDFARRYGYERSQRQRLDALLTVASLAASAFTVEDVLPSVAHAVRDSTGADVCNIYVFDESGEQVADMFSDGLNDREQWVVSQSDIYAVSEVPAETRIQRTLEPEVIRSIEHDLVPGSALVVYARDVGIHQILLVPIVYQREMTGVMYVWYRDSRHQFSDEAIRTAQAIANQAGGVVSRARLHEATQRHIDETEALLRIGRTVLSSEALDVVLDEIADVLDEMISYDYAYVAMLSERENSLFITRAWGELPETVYNQELPLDGSLTGSAVTSGELVNVADAHADSRSFRFQPTYLPIRSAMIAPLATDDGVIGALYLGRKAGGGFSARQQRLMSLLSQQAAIAIERTKARESLARRAQRHTLLATVADRLASTDDLDVALPEIAAKASGVLADGMVIALATWEHGGIEWAGTSFGDSEQSTRLNELLRSVDLAPFSDMIETTLLGGTSVELPGDWSTWLTPEQIAGLRQLQVARVLVVPMPARGRSPGLLFLLGKDASDQFQPDVIEVAELVAGRIGDAAERRNMSRNRAALLRASEEMSRKTDLHELLPLITRELSEIVPYDSIYIGELDRVAGVTRTLHILNPLGHRAEDVELASNEGLSGEAMRARVPLINNQAHLHESSTYASEAAAVYYRTHGESIMAAPLIAQNEVVGILFMGRTGEKRFSNTDFETFKLFAGISASAIRRAMLIRRNQEIYRASVEVLAAVVDARDPTTHQHSRNVAYYARVCAELLGLDPCEVEQVELAGLLHDVGKLSLPDEILAGEDVLDSSKYSLIEKHCVKGAAILAQHPAMSGLVPLVLHHHERHDGCGYPNRLAGDDVPLGASIIAVVDAFDTMVSRLPHPTPHALDEALEELLAGAGTKFRPIVVETFVKGVRSGEVSLWTGNLTDAAISAVTTVVETGHSGSEELSSG